MTSKNLAAVYLGLTGLGVGLLIGGGGGFVAGRFGARAFDKQSPPTAGVPKGVGPMSKAEAEQRLLGKSLADVVAILGPPVFGPVQEGGGRTFYQWPPLIPNPRTGKMDRYLKLTFSGVVISVEAD